MTDTTQEYENLIIAGKYRLGPDEFWCVIDPGGEPMAGTASKRFDDPVLTFCNALTVDWEDAKEIGYRLGTVSLTNGDLG